MLRVGMISAAHVHAPSYGNCLAGHPEAEFVGLFDDDAERATKFTEKWGGQVFPTLDALIAASDAVVICSPNMQHAEHIEAAAKAGKPILCEKPLAPTKEHAQRIQKAMDESGVLLTTAFPCPYSPAFQRLCERVKAGEIGKVLAVNATNRGRCPYGWFIEPELSGGGAMIDHVVHVTDLLRRLLGEEPVRVVAQIGNNMYGGEWDDTAHLTIDFASGIFATLDSSWSRPQNYRTWGDVTLKVLGEKGVIEVDLFDQGVSVLTDAYRHNGTGSDLDGSMISNFIDAVLGKAKPNVTALDGLQASRVAIAGYESAKSGTAVAIA